MSNPTASPEDVLDAVFYPTSFEAALGRLREASQRLSDSYDRLNETLERCEALLRDQYRTEGSVELKGGGYLCYGPLKGRWSLYVYGKETRLKSESVAVRLAALQAFSRLVHDIEDQLSC